MRQRAVGLAVSDLVVGFADACEPRDHDRVGRQGAAGRIDRHSVAQPEGIAEDQGKVLRTNATVSIESCGELEDVVKTKEWSMLSPGEIEHKFYAPDKGLVLINELMGRTVRVELADSIPVDFDCLVVINDFLTNRFGVPDCPPEPDCADLPIHLP